MERSHAGFFPLLEYLVELLYYLVVPDEFQPFGKLHLVVSIKLQPFGELRLFIVRIELGFLVVPVELQLLILTVELQLLIIVRIELIQPSIIIPLLAPSGHCPDLSRCRGRVPTPRSHVLRLHEDPTCSDHPDQFVRPVCSTRLSARLAARAAFHPREHGDRRDCRRRGRCG